MTNKERIIKTLLCEKTDRAPFSAWLGFAPWGETTERWKKESGIADLDIWSCFGFEPFFHGVTFIELLSRDGGAGRVSRAG